MSDNDLKLCRPVGDGRYMIFCPACSCGHMIKVGTWSFNGDLDRPTINPSILVRGVQPITDDEADRILNGEIIPPRPLVCHSFVRDGMIQFLTDCTHDLAGKTVALEPF